MKLYIDTGMINIYLSYGHDIPADGVHIDSLYATCDTTYHYKFDDGGNIEINFIFDKSSPMLAISDGSVTKTLICLPTRIFSMFCEDDVDEIFSSLKTNPAHVIRNYAAHQIHGSSVEEFGDAIAIICGNEEGFFEIPMSLGRLIHYVEEYEWIMRCIGKYYFCLTTLHYNTDFTVETITFDFMSMGYGGYDGVYNKLKNDIEGGRDTSLIDHNIHHNLHMNKTTLELRFPFNVDALKQARILYFFDNFLSNYENYPATQQTISLGRTL